MAATMISFISTNPPILTRWARTTNYSTNINARARKYQLKNSLRPIEEQGISPTFDFKCYMHENVAFINKALDIAVPLKEPLEIFEPMRYSLFTGGKRLRAMLIMTTCELVGGQEQTAVPCACAMEMIHTMSMVNDDLPIMDNHDFRRGKDACHRVFGDAPALMACAGLLPHAFDHLVTHTNGLVSSEKIVSITRALAQGSGPEGLMAGQLLDTISPPQMMSELDWLEHLHMLKTVILMEKSMVVGAILGGASDEEVQRLRLFGRRVGRLFGVMDDIFDAEEDALVADKRTYPKALGMEKARELAEKLRSEAQAMLRGFGYDDDKVTPLSALVDFIAYRDFQ